MIEAIQKLAHNPFVVTGVLIAVNAMIDNLPAPDVTSGKFYRFFYGTVHSIIGRVKSAKAGLSNGNGNGMSLQQAQVQSQQASKYDVR